MKTIRLYPAHHNKVAKVSDCDYKELSRYEWKYYLHKPSGHEYAIRYITTPTGRQGSISMHRHVLGLMNGQMPKYGDHADRDGLNNQRSNLRDSTVSQNLVNSRKYQRPGATSKFKGVFKNKYLSTAKNPDGVWYASFTINKKRTNLGAFETEIEAAKAYDEAAVRLGGPFALTNRKLGLLK